MRICIVLAALAGAALVIAGAVGAHAVPDAAGERWASALNFGFIHVLAALFAASRMPAGRLSAASAILFLAGVAFFSGIQIAKMLYLGANPDAVATPFDALSMLVPVGGISLIAGWVALAAAAAFSPKT
jgi:uncharacterized membrane protein YgdD (TMEM256/DUF423 family)